MINCQVVQTVYCIEVSIDEFTKIMDYDTNADEVVDTLYGKLDLVDGISDIEYDGHFGAKIWVKIDKEYDNGKTWNQIDEIITKII